MTAYLLSAIYPFLKFQKYFDFGAKFVGKKKDIYLKIFQFLYHIYVFYRYETKYVKV